MRELWLRIHRWLGLAIGIFFLIASGTGAILVYEDELDAWINRDAWPVTPGDVGPERVLATVESVLPGELRGLRFPLDREPVYRADVLTLEGRREVISIDPGTGEVVEPKRSLNRVMFYIRITHTSLASGPWGRRIVLTSTWLALVSLVTGVILWWPGIRRMLRGMVVRTRRGFYAFNYDLHQVSGILALPFLFVMSATGVLFHYADEIERVVRPVVGEGPGVRGWPEVTITERGDGTVRATPLELLAAGMRAVPDAEPKNLTVPRRLDRPAVLAMLREGEYGPGSYIYVMLDPNDASVVLARDPRLLTRAGRFANSTTGNLHVGAVGGPIVRVLYVITSAIGVLLVIGGFLVWWLKRRRIDAVAQRRGDADRVAAVR